MAFHYSLPPLDLGSYGVLELKINLITGLLTGLTFIVLRRASRLLTIFRSGSHFTKLYTAFEPFAFPGLLFPTTKWTTGFSWHWIQRFESYKNSETVNLVPIISGKSVLWTSNIDIGRQVAAGGNRTSFVKPETASGAFLTWGMSLAAADGLVWRKHRRVVGPAFGTQLYKLVWTQTAKTYHDMIEVEGWEKKDVVEIPIIQKLTLKLAFLIISNCGFGFPSTWAVPPEAADGGMPIQEALRLVAENYLIDLLVPKWLMHLPIPKFKMARIGRDRLSQYMREQIAERKARVAAGGDLSADAFTMLVKANQDESSKYQLDDQELIGNVFVFMFAGHETTAHSFAATLGFMAIHPDVQDEVVEQIMSVVGSERDPVWSMKTTRNLTKFSPSSTRPRMFPAGHVLIREATEDTVLNIPNPVGEEGSKTVPVPKGSQVIVDMVGVQYNPRYFEDPEVHKPSRWYGLPSDSELFTAFSVGPRACIGRKFATTEATCFLALLLRDWKVMPLLRDGESNEAWRARVLDAHIVLTLGVTDVPVKFVRRVIEN
ncbi:cytochrome P450 [Mycena rebaudengoi]|nr:cytochrome P450 [Mycena rebaudengoi]